MKECRRAEEGEPRECVALDRIAVGPLALSEQGARPFVRVDSLAISSLCTGECLDAAAAFVAHVTSESEVLSALLPHAPGNPPHYLLPALSSLYENEDLREQAPLYGLLLSALEGAVPAEGRGLNRRLRAIGAHLDRNVLGP